MCLDFCRLKSPPVASQEDTPKSAIWMVPSSPSRMFPALISLKVRCVIRKAFYYYYHNRIIIEAVCRQTGGSGRYCENIQGLLELL